MIHRLGVLIMRFGNLEAMPASWGGPANFKMSHYQNSACIDPRPIFRVNTRPMNLNRAFSSRRRASLSGARRSRARI
jgi:hypothetical protein